MRVAIVERDRFVGEQRAIYFKGFRCIVMPPNQSCPEEASTLLPMAGTARLTDPMRPWMGMNSIRVLRYVCKQDSYCPCRLNPLAIGHYCDFLVQKVCVGFPWAPLQQKGRKR